MRDFREMWLVQKIPGDLFLFYSKETGKRLNAAPMTRNQSIAFIAFNADIAAKITTIEAFYTFPDMWLEKVDENFVKEIYSDDAGLREKDFSAWADSAQRDREKIIEKYNSVLDEILK